MSTSPASTSPAAPAKILIVEDEPRLAAVLRDYLAAAGMVSEWVDDGGQVIDAFARYQPDLVLLDLMLPQRDGVDLCRELRASSDVPVIMVTARVEEIDRLLGLEIGADDYICKPFSPREVVARVVAVLRRYRPDPAARTNSGLHIDEPAARATWNGKGLDLTPVEYRLLRTLLATPGRIWARDELLDRLYLDHRVVVDRTVDSHVRNLRRKLADAGMEGEPIRSVYGMGYSYEP
ncbi:response regulator [Stenotrophomonas forensis]